MRCLHQRLLFLVFSLILFNCKGSSNTSQQSESDEAQNQSLQDKSRYDLFIEEAFIPPNSQDVNAQEANAQDEVIESPLETSEGVAENQNISDEIKSDELKDESRPEKTFETKQNDFDADDDGFRAGEDCDDQNAHIHPHAKDVYVNSRFVDQNCDGRIEISLKHMTQFFDGEVDSDLLGYAVSMAGDVNADGCEDFLMQASNEQNNLTGIVYLVYGRGEVCEFKGDYPALQRKADGVVVFEGENAFDQMGTSMAKAGDVNADGCDDFLLATPDFNNGRGRVYLLMGRSAQCAYVGDYPKLSSSSHDGLFYFDGGPNYRLGQALTALGDVNGDGYDDFMLSAPHYQSATGISAEGAVLLVLGQSLEQGSTYTQIYSVDAKYTTSDHLLGSGWMFILGTSGGGLGNALTKLGDVNQDGLDDLLLAESGFSRNRGVIKVILGNTDLTQIDPLNPKLELVGDDSLAGLGQNIQGVGDVDHNGYADLLVLKNQAKTGESQVELMLGQNDLSQFKHNSLDFDGLVPNSEWGRELSAIGDLNRDGCTDFAISASLASFDGFEESGSVSLYQGQGEGCVQTEKLTTTTKPSLTFYGSESGARAGFATAGGDVNGDGFSDVLISEYKHNASGIMRGRVYVIYGQSL